MRGRLLLGVVALAAAAAGARADVVHLKSGRRLVGRAEELDDGARVRVTLDVGVVTLSRDDIERIERAELPHEGVARRLAALGDGDVRAALTLAADAEHAGLAAEAGIALERAASWAPDDAEVAAALRRWRVHVRRLPDDPAGDAALLAAFGPGARLHRTDHFRIAYDVPPEEARRRGASLEAAYRKLFELSAKLGLDAAPVDRRLDVVLFADHARWLASTGRTAEELRDLSGLYVHATGRVHLFDTSTLPDVVAARAALDEARANLAAYETALADRAARLDAIAADFEDVIRRADADRRRRAHEALAKARAELDAAEEQAAAERRRIAEFERGVDAHLERENLATTTHEACHQLAFATGVCRPGQPLWLLEGLATLFEVSSRLTFVPEAVNPMRLSDLRVAWDAGRATPLADVVTDAVFLAPGADRLAAYAEAWSLAYHLSRKCPEAFAHYVRASRPRPVAPESAAGRLEDFRRSFGVDLEAVERAWREDVRGLRLR